MGWVLPQPAPTRLGRELQRLIRGTVHDEPGGQTALAKLLRVNRGSLSRWVHGNDPERALPGPGEARKLWDDPAPWSAPDREKVRAAWRLDRDEAASARDEAELAAPDRVAIASGPHSPGHAAVLSALDTLTLDEGDLHKLALFLGELAATKISFSEWLLGPLRRAITDAVDNEKRSRAVVPTSPPRSDQQGPNVYSRPA